MSAWTCYFVCHCFDLIFVSLYFSFHFHCSFCGILKCKLMHFHKRKHIFSPARWWCRYYKIIIACSHIYFWMALLLSHQTLTVQVATARNRNVRNVILFKCHNVTRNERRKQPIWWWYWATFVANNFHTIIYGRNNTVYGCFHFFTTLWLFVTERLCHQGFSHGKLNFSR